MPAEDNKLLQSSDGMEESPQYSEVSTFFVGDLLKTVKSEANNQVKKQHLGSSQKGKTEY